MSSMRDTLEATFKEIEEREEDTSDDTSSEETSTDAAKSEPADETEDSVSGEDEGGAEDKDDEEEEKTPPADKKVPDPKAAAADKLEAAKDGKSTADKVPGPPQDKTLVNPPITWKAKAKAEWNKIPDTVKREIRRREQDALDGLKQYKEAAAIGERLSKTIQPYHAMLTARNTTPENAVREALDLAYKLSTGTPQQRGAILRHVAQHYGADLTAPSPEQDKTAQALQPLVSKIQQLEQALQHSQMSERQRQTQTLEQQVSEFAAATDETGALKYPYFEEVRDLMATYLESGRAKNLAQAYKQAVKADPEISQLVQSEQTTAEKKRNDELQRQEKARKNQQVNFQRKPASAAKTAPEGTMRDTIQATYERLMQQSA